jgi:hypothetical protein
LIQVAGLFFDQAQGRFQAGPCAMFDVRAQAVVKAPGGLRELRRSAADTLLRQLLVAAGAWISPGDSMR